MPKPHSFARRLHRRSLTGWAIVIFLVTANQAMAADFSVSSASDISSAMNAAQPGDVLIMTDGVWTNQDIDFAGHGTAASPITLRSQTPGGVLLNGTSQLSISGSHLVVDGLNFNGGGSGNLRYVVQFRGPQGDARHCRLTNTQILNYNAPDINTRYHWVNLYGQDNRVDHCRFAGQNHSGVTLVVVLNDNGQAARHRIDKNAFLNRPEGNGNGFETIRIGTGARATISAQVVVESNLFENCDGEIEIISNKSGDNVYRYNTFRSCAGTLTLRNGKRATVEGNFFLGQGKNRSGGIRVVDSDHTIVNNYIAAVDDRADGAISLAAGTDGGLESLYKTVTNVDIHNNTIVDVSGATVIFDWGFGNIDDTGVQNQLPQNVSFINNLIRSTSAPLFEGQEGSDFEWRDNIAFGVNLGIPAREGLRTVNPQIALDADGLWRPTSGSPAINSGTTLDAVTIDIDGQPRVDALDIGADEASVAAITIRPLTCDDVGPTWDSAVGPPTTPPAGNFFALQAEEYSSITDPDGDGRTWNIVSDASAHAGAAIESPAGTRTDLPAQQAIALYNVTFNAAGTYTAYYRASGDSTGSNSFYAPTDFGVDPTINVSTSADGTYRWETGGQFTVAASNVGVAQQLRIGRRESGNRIDAIVIHPSSTLSAEQLDALFSDAPFVLGDINLDGVVSFLDINPFITLLSNGEFQPEADCNQDGVVNFLDITPWIALVAAP